MNAADVRISLEYRTFQNPEAWVTVPMDARAFCDWGEEDGRIDLYFVTKHLDVRQFIDAPIEHISKVRWRATDPIDGFERREEITYWNAGKCRLTERYCNLPEDAQDHFAVQVKVVPSDTTATVIFQRAHAGYEVSSYIVRVNGEYCDWQPEIEGRDGDGTRGGG